MDKFTLTVALLLAAGLRIAAITLAIVLLTAWLAARAVGYLWLWAFARKEISAAADMVRQRALMRDQVDLSMGRLDPKRVAEVRARIRRAIDDIKRDARDLG